MHTWGDFWWKQTRNPEAQLPIAVRPLTTVGRPAWIILAVSIVHIIAGFVVLGWGGQNNIPLAGLMKAFGNRYLLSAVLLSAGTMAILARWKMARPTGVMAMISLQQLIVILEIATAIQAVVTGHYPDGVVRHWPFILTDQTPLLALCIAHTVGIIDYCTGIFSLKIAAPDFVSDYRNFEPLFDPLKPDKLSDKTERT